MPKKRMELDEIKTKLADISDKLDQLLKLQSLASHKREFVPSTLSSLPKHLRLSASTIAKMGQATAEQVAAETGRARAAESDYLNQLASHGFLKKQRKGREVYFQVFALYTICPQCGVSVHMSADHCTTCGASLVRKLWQ